MAEYGKPMLMVNLLRYIRQFTMQHNLSICYLNWKNDISEISWLTDDDVELSAPEGSVNIEAVCSWLHSHPEATCMILSDGYFALNAEQRSQLTNLDNLYLIGVGGDANLTLLNTLSEHSYQAEQIDQVLHEVNRPKSAIVPPLNRVCMSATVLEDNGDDDEW